LTAVLLSLCAGAGMYLLYTRVALGRRDLVGRSGSWRQQARRRWTPDRWLAEVGLDHLQASELAAAVALLFVLGVAGGAVVFGGILPALVLGLFAAGLPVATFRQRRRGRLAVAQEAWPRMIEEIRILTGSSGRSIPQALFDVGRRAPDELRPAFEAAHREWMLSTDFGRTLSLLKAKLVDPTADATCETLLIAHELGGADLDRRLEALADDRRHDIQGRKDARAKQAGARFARRFVLIVPLGMALAGMSVGNGRAAYGTPMGQVLVVLALLLVVACWIWAGLVMRLPEPERVFTE
jgi:tight adherence protein B